MENLNYAIIEVHYESSRKTKVQSAIMSEEVFLKHEDKINEALSSEFWEPDMDGKHSHIQGVGYAEIVDFQEALEFFQDEKFGWSHEVEEKMMYFVNLEVARDLNETLSKFKDCSK